MRSSLDVAKLAAAIVKRETTIPLVMIGDPVGTKLVWGNATKADHPNIDADAIMRSLF